ncbi:nucleotidyltransferase family protein, partial [Rhizobiaceae bacterium]|nr:nucleotidyltransferase family protein [Rhizobiaceae bacterium]
SSNKLREVWRNKPLLLHVVEAALTSRCDAVRVVVGHDADAVRALLPEGVRSVYARHHATGLSASLRAGIASVDDDMLVLLGDMPLVEAAHLDAMIDALGDLPVVATADGAAGNPVLWPAAYKPRFAALEGDAGAKALLADGYDTVEIGEAAGRDFDVPEAFTA